MWLSYPETLEQVRVGCAMETGVVTGRSLTGVVEGLLPTKIMGSVAG
jgi:hypothetical protein